MRIAALDLGSNSFHLLVCEARLDGSFSPLAREKEMLRLGDQVARTGRIGRESTARAVEVIARFKAIAEANHADETIALGTAAIREAEDGVAFVNRVRAETGVEIEVVDGVVEARLIFTAIRSSVLIEPAPALAADLGGGSLEVMVGDQGALMYAASLRLGVGRLTAELVSTDPPSRRDRRRLEERVRGELAPVLAEARELKPRMLIGSSGTFSDLAKMAVAERGGGEPASLNQVTVARAELLALERAIFGADAEARAKLPGGDQKRAELLPAGIIVLNHLMEETGLGELTISDWALREGVVLNAIGGHDRAELADDPRALRRASVLSLCRRSNWRQPHARQVAAIAVALFDVTAQLHRLPPEDRELLELAALLHDIGEHVSRVDHDRHTAYLIEHGGLRGFTPEEVRMLSLIGRFHVRGTPRPHSAGNGALTEDERQRVLGLTALLRVADSLDASHAGSVGAIRLEKERAGTVTLRIAAKGDAELEQWAFRRKRGLFEKSFGRRVEAVFDRQGREDFEAAELVPGYS
ncbi:MAG TPA: Ppx/GppA phosphatase family protein [Acidimicrobiales bacterium]|nr:Ppx/GppA phosphatase family protein [Acidimicrobiales bacterium]